MKVIATIVLLIFVWKPSAAQRFLVVESRKTFSSDSRKIKKGDTLDLTTEFAIEKKGRIEIVHPNKWRTHHAVPGNYRMNGLLAELKRKREYVKHDSIFELLKSNNIDRCDFPYKLICKPILFGNATYLADNIKQGERRIKTNGSSVRLEWEYPDDSQRKYFLLVTNLFEEFIDIVTTRDTSLDLNLTPYQRHGAILYKVISDECRESDYGVIVMTE